MRASSASRAMRGRWCSSSSAPASTTGRPATRRRLVANDRAELGLDQLARQVLGLHADPALLPEVTHAAQGRREDLDPGPAGVPTTKDPGGGAATGCARRGHSRRRRQPRRGRWRRARAGSRRAARSRLTGRPVATHGTLAPRHPRHPRTAGHIHGEHRVSGALGRHALRREAGHQLHAADVDLGVAAMVAAGAQARPDPVAPVPRAQGRRCDPETLGHDSDRPARLGHAAPRSGSSGSTGSGSPGPVEPAGCGFMSILTVHVGRPRRAERSEIPVMDRSDADRAQRS